VSPAWPAFQMKEERLAQIQAETRARLMATMVM
jgi:hypothetical protein